MKKNLIKFIAMACIGGAAAVVSSCATDKTPKPPHERINTIPHNRPQSWEGGSPFGGFGQSR